MKPSRTQVLALRRQILALESSLQRQRLRMDVARLSDQLQPSALAWQAVRRMAAGTTAIWALWRAVRRWQR